MKSIERYKTTDGRCPYRDWIESLDLVIQARIYAYVDRVASGGAKKNIKPVGAGVYEIKIDVGPGFRVYFGEVGSAIVLLLVGGDKSTQNRDIRQAIEFWRDYETQ